MADTLVYQSPFQRGPVMDLASTPDFDLDSYLTGGASFFSSPLKRCAIMDLKANTDFNAGRLRPLGLRANIQDLIATDTLMPLAEELEGGRNLNRVVSQGNLQPDPEPAAGLPNPMPEPKRSEAIPSVATPATSNRSTPMPDVSTEGKIIGDSVPPEMYDRVTYGHRRSFRRFLCRRTPGPPARRRDTETQDRDWLHGIAIVPRPEFTFERREPRRPTFPENAEFPGDVRAFATWLTLMFLFLIIAFFCNGRNLGDILTSMLTSLYDYFFKPQKPPQCTMKFLFKYIWGWLTR